MIVKTTIVMHSQFDEEEARKVSELSGSERALIFKQDVATAKEILRDRLRVPTDIHVEIEEVIEWEK